LVTFYLRVHRGEPQERLRLASGADSQRISGILL